MITKQMLARCQNELKQAFCALDKDVQHAIIINGENAQCCDHIGAWYDKHFTRNMGLVWRLSPDTPTEQEHEEIEINKNDAIYGCNEPNYGVCLSISECACHKRFIGIIYRDKDGKETLRTSVDAALGVPVRVRFAKE